MKQIISALILCLFINPALTGQDIDTDTSGETEFVNAEMLEFADLLEKQKELEERSFEKIQKIFEREGFEIKATNVNQLMGLQLSCDKDVALMDKQNLRAFMQAEKRAMKVLWQMNRKYQRYLEKCDLEPESYAKLASKYLESPEFRDHIDSIDPSSTASLTIFK